MKTRLVLAFSCLAVLTAHSQVVLNVTFDGQTSGAQPTGTSAIRPTTNTAAVYTSVVSGAGNYAGGGAGEGVRIFDNDSSIAPGLDYNFVANTASQLTYLKVEFNASNVGSLGSSTTSLNFSLGNYSTSTTLLFGSSNNRAFQFQLFSDGNLRLGGSSTNNQATNVQQLYKVTLFINDSETESMTYLDPASTLDTLAANSVVFYLGNAKINTVALAADNTGWDNSGASLGRLGFAGSTTSVGMDWNIDNIVVTALPVPEPAATGLGALGLAAMALRRRR
jgi:hypothetical protein